MSSRLRALLYSPTFLLAAVALLTAFAVQSGELGTSDTGHRLQTAHSWWTSEPPVFPNEYPEFGLHGRGGKLYGWYGMGQSLLMLPADIVGTYVEQWPMFDGYHDDPSVRDIIVSYSTNMLVCTLALLVCFRFLRRLEFSVNQALAGALALLFCTTFLHYTQNMMENNYIMLLTLTGFAFQYEWLQTGHRKALIIGSTALGLNLLTRLTTGMDLMAAGLFVALVLWLEKQRGRELWQRLVSYLKTALPIYLVFGLIDRVYQFYRFGSFFNTYMHVFGDEQRKLNPSLPPNFPMDGLFHVGFLGPLITPEKSIFLFDPLVILTAICAFVLWRRFSAPVKAYVITASVLLLAYISFYARYTVWSGDFAWGDRYVSTAVQLVAFISVPLLLRYRAYAGRVVWGLGMVLVAASVVVQIASLIFWLPLEIYQMETLGHPTFVIGLRLKNIVAFTLGKMDAWGLTNHAMQEDPWDYVHITTYNFLPFLLRQVGVVSRGVWETAFAVWLASLAGLGGALSLLFRRMARGEFETARPSALHREPSVKSAVL
jgi:hypothetical protein